MPARIAAVLLLGLGCMLGSHWLMTRDPASPWNAVILITPMLAAAALGFWRSGQRGRSLLLQALIAGLVWQALTGVRVAAPLLYLGQHAVIHLLLAAWFASSLRQGAQPMISMLAEKVHGYLTPTMAVYCRHVTQAWVVYFAGMAVVSVLLFATTSFDTWAIFANLLTPLSVAVMFIGERFLRYQLHPEFERASLLDAVRAYRSTSRAPLASPADARATASRTPASAEAEPVETAP